MTQVTYPFDPSGSNPLNRIVNEQQVVTSVNDPRKYNVIMPSAAPFFADSVVMEFRRPDGSVRSMVEGVDFYYTHGFISASKATAKPVYGSITFLDRDTSGVMRLTYQTLGGIWTLDDNEIAQILANIINNPRTTAWEQITDMPVMFPVIDHEWNLVDMVGAKEIVQSLDALAQAVVSNTGGGLASHVASRSNPHEVTKAQVGLGSVENYPIATQTQAQAGTNNTAYMTPLRVKEAITAQVGNVVAAHADRTDNPHQVTKAQIGLGNVDNYATATAAQAVTGTATDLFMTPAGTKAVVDTVRTALATHVADQNNPHAVDKTDVGLNNVENYAIATAAEAQGGTVSNKYMTPQRTAQAINALANQGLATHINDKTNPHETTKAQVGLGNVENYPVANQAEAEAGIALDRYMTALRVKQAITAQAAGPLQTHINDANNPHATTAAQVGAYSRNETDQLLAGHVNNTNNPHATTAAQVGAYTKSEVDQMLANRATATSVQAVQQNLDDQIGQIIGMLNDLTALIAAQ